MKQVKKKIERERTGQRKAAASRKEEIERLEKQERE